jgi:hypothetical protein
MQFCTSRQFAHSLEERLAKVFAILGAVLFVLGSSPVQSRAGDVSAQPADNLNVSTPAVSLLPQSQAAESGWLSGLHISGYASQTFGMW